jgi:hypothetical protein
MYNTDKPFMPYEPIDFKRVPNWAAACKYRAIVDAVLNASQGSQVTQLSLVACAKCIFIEREVDIPHEALEKGVYVVRAVLSQLANMKRKGRTISREWQPRFQTIYDKITLNEGGGDECDTEDELVIGVAVVKPPCPQVDIIESDSEDVLKSNNPALQQLLDEGADDNPQLQQLLDGAKSEESVIAEAFESSAAMKRPKPTPAAMKMPKPKPAAMKRPASITSAELQSLAVASQQACERASPAAWIALTKEKKLHLVDAQADNKKGKKKATKKRKGKKTKAKSKTTKGTGEEQDDNAKPTWQTLKKRLHSKAYHDEYNYCTKHLGLADDVSKLRAQTAGASHVTKITSDYDRGLFNDALHPDDRKHASADSDADDID